MSLSHCATVAVSQNDVADIVSNVSSGPHKESNELVLQLTVQLAEAINLQDRDLIAQLHETIRCVRQFDNHECVLLSFFCYV